MTGDAHIT